MIWNIIYYVGKKKEKSERKEKEIKPKMNWNLNIYDNPISKTIAWSCQGLLLKGGNFVICTISIGEIKIALTCFK